MPDGDLHRRGVPPAGRGNVPAGSRRCVSVLRAHLLDEARMVSAADVSASRPGPKLQPLMLSTEEQAVLESWTHWETSLQALRAHRPGMRGT